MKLTSTNISIGDSFLYNNYKCKIFLIDDLYYHTLSEGCPVVVNQTTLEKYKLPKMYLGKKVWSFQKGYDFSTIKLLCERCK